MEKRQIILPSKRFFKAEEESLNIRVNLDETENLMREGDRTVMLDLVQLFDEERNKSKKYKIHGKLKMVFRNLYSGTTPYVPLVENLYLINETGTNIGYVPYNEFAFLRNDVVREVILPSSASGSTLTSFTPNIVITGGTTTGHTVTTPISAPYKNWNICLSYVYSGDSNHPMVYTLSGATKIENQNIINFKSGDGVPFRLSYSGGSYYEFTSPVEHGMNQGEYVTIYNSVFTGSTSGRTFYISKVGNEVYNSEKYVINILKNTMSTGITSQLTRLIIGKRCLNINDISGSTSNYYVHKHKILKGSADYLLDKIGFESSIFETERKLLFENALGVNDVIVERNRMESLIYDFKEVFELTGITNNLKYTPTEVYVSIFLRNQNGYFTYPPKTGWKFNFHDTWIDNHFSGNTQLETNLQTTAFTSNASSAFTGGTVINVGTSGFTGAFVEYNDLEFKERIISEVYHKFTHRVDIFDHYQTGYTPTINFSGATTNNPYGYFYQPYHRVKLRQLSEYIETSKTSDIYNLPENVKYFPKEGLWKWRDLYDHGFIDTDGNGTIFPFMNDVHYVKHDINFYLRNEQIYNNKVDALKNFTGKTLLDC